MNKENSSERSNKLEQSERARKRQDQRLILRKSLIWCFVLITAFLIFTDQSQVVKQTEVQQPTVQIVSNDETVALGTVEREPEVTDSVSHKVQELGQESQQTEEKAVVEQLPETDIQSRTQSQTSIEISEPAQSANQVPSQQSTQQSQTVPTQSQTAQQISKTSTQSIQSGTAQTPQQKIISAQTQVKVQNLSPQQPVKLQ